MRYATFLRKWVFINSLFSLSACIPQSVPPQTQPLVEFFSFTAPQHSQPAQLLSRTLLALGNSAPNPNLHALGLRPLLYVQPGRWMAPRYRSERTIPHSVYFLNMGHDAFLLAQLGDEHSLKTLSIYSRYNISEPPEFAPLAVPHELLSTLGAKFEAEAVSLAITPVLGPESSCAPKGAHTLQETYLVKPSLHAGCIFFRTPQDVRFPKENFESRLACYNTKKSLFWDTRLDKAQFIFPVSPTEVAVYEGAYTPPRVTHVNTETGSLKEDSRLKSATIYTDQPIQHPIPEIPLALYECSQSTIRISPEDVGSANQQSNYMIDSEIFWGQREPNPLEDTVWHTGFDSENHFFSQRLSWAQASALLPGFSSFPAPICALANVVDVKCALATLQMAANTALEFVTSASTPSPLRAQKSLFTFTLLKNIQTKMEDWVLDEETWKLMQLFANDVKNSPTQNTLPEAERLLATEFLESTEPNFAPKAPDSHKAMLAYLNVPEAFWNALLQDKK